MGPALACSTHVPTPISFPFTTIPSLILEQPRLSTLFLQIKQHYLAKLIRQMKDEPDKVKTEHLAELCQILIGMNWVNREYLNQQLFFKELNELIAHQCAQERVQYLPLILRINDRTKHEIDYIDALIELIDKIRSFFHHDVIDLKLDRIDFKDANIALKNIFLHMHRDDPGTVEKFFRIWSHFDCIKKCNYKNSVSAEELASQLEIFVAKYQSKVQLGCFHREGLQLISELAYVLRRAVLVEQFLNNHRSIKSEVREPVLAHCKRDYAEYKNKLAAHININLNKRMAWFSITKSIARSNPTLIHNLTN